MNNYWNNGDKIQKWVVTLKKVYWDGLLIQRKMNKDWMAKQKFKEFREMGKLRKL